MLRDWGLTVEQAVLVSYSTNGGGSIALVAECVA